jgi:TetR/AcrR family transcriptional regulator
MASNPHDPGKPGRGEPGSPGRPAGRRATPKAERTRAAILEAAELSFAERGFDGTRLEDVAERVGIRRASIVYYFRDKPALYDAVLADVLGGLYDVVAPALGSRAPLLARIDLAVSAWVDYVGQRPTFARLLLREIAGASGPEGPAMLRHTGPFVELARRTLAESRSEPGAVRAEVDPAHLAATIAGATVFFVSAIPTLFPALKFDPLAKEQLDAHRAEVLRITHRLLGGNGDRRERSSGEEET